MNRQTNLHTQDINNFIINKDDISFNEYETKVFIYSSYHNLENKLDPRRRLIEIDKIKLGRYYD